ncbi:two-pore potassium channel 5 isoform X2 [Prunus avium]|uniref:Two-pore potassium channel 5 isoform X2 n=1 Tax=Prunus avium TaxID=42229 RepID=A0A6P5RLD9_PRUAV|nr:two-pore potassium channel 5 isoform X2 [Prunus avium]
MENEPFLGSQTGPQHQLQPIIEDHDFSFKIAPSPSDPTLLIFQEPQQHHVQQDPQSSSSTSTTQFGAPSARTKKPGTLHRCKTAPAMAVMRDLKPKTTQIPKPQSESSSIIRDKFSGIETHPVVDALYFCIVTMCTIGYGDIAPTTPFTKIFACVFVLFGFGFIDILLSGVVNFVLDLQENMILTGIQMGQAQAQAQAHSHRFSARDYIVDVAKGRMRIRLKVGLALGVVVLSIGMGALVLCFVENLNWIDSIYLSVMSVTTVGYGDRAFKTIQGRLFAAVWLLFSTLAVARAFMYLAEARVDKRHRRIIKWVLDRDITVQDLLAANINNHGFISKSEYVIHKLKEMGKIGEKDILQICNQFSKLDQNHSGKITLPDLLENRL